MRHLTYVLFLACFVFNIFFLLLSTSTVQAKSVLSASNISLSDAIYADLAVRGYLSNVSIYYTDGNPSNDIKLNETLHWLPASTVKTFAAMYAYKLINEGKLNLSDTVTIDAKNDVPTELVTPELPTLLVGDNVTIDRLIRQMITQSDNTAFNQLLDILGRDKITSYIQSLGLTHSHVGSKLNLDDSQTEYEYDVPGYGVNVTTAEDYAKAFLLIKNDKIPGASDLFNVLKQQKINNMIPLFLPSSVICAHKTGDLDPLYHDGGICEDKKHSYVLTIFTNAGDPNLVAHLSQIIYTKNYALVGQNLDSAVLGQNTNENPPLDPLLLHKPENKVLGVNSQTVNFPIPDITAADLGLKASNLSLVLPNSKLPQITIPADSPLHPLSDLWQITKLAFANGPQARTQVNLQIALLRLAEARDLTVRGKTQQAQAILSSVQQGLDVISKDTTIKTDIPSQDTIQAVSETRFSLLKNQLQNAKDIDKPGIIMQIAQQAKDTIQNVQPDIPEATNATNPTQKPLIGTIVGSTETNVTVKTAGGQQITIPTTNNLIPIQEEQMGLSPTPSPTFTPTLTVSISPSIAPMPTKPVFKVGSTVAIVGSTIDNQFTPSVILTNVPKELAAPEPVTVANVDTKHNTMVVVENGIYTQVNINKNTIIKGADTNIPLKSIQTGDVVIVHGEPLTQTQESQTPPSNGAQTIQSITPTQTRQSSTNQAQLTVPTSSATTLTPITTGNPTITIPVTSPISKPSVQTTSSPTTQPKATSTPSTFKTPAGKTTTQKITPSAVQQKVTGIHPTLANSSVTQVASPNHPAVTPSISTQTQPKVIQSTSIQVVETKNNVPAQTNTTTKPNSQPAQPAQQNSNPQQSQPQAASVPQKTIAPPSNTSSGDNKKSGK